MLELTVNLLIQFKERKNACKHSVVVSYRPYRFQTYSFCFTVMEMASFQVRSVPRVTQARRPLSLTRSAIIWKRTSIDQVLPIRTKTMNVPVEPEKESWYGSPMSPINRCGSPESSHCTGYCRDNHSEEEEPVSADVVGVSSNISQTFNKQLAHLSFVSKKNPDFLVTGKHLG